MNNKESTGSVTEWIHSLKEDQDNEATELVWNRYFDRLLQITKLRLAKVNANRRVSDEEDIVIATFHDLFRQAKEGKFPSLSDRDDLWKILLKISEYKAINKHRDENRIKRGEGRVRGDSFFEGDRDASGMGRREMAVAPEPTPEVSLIMQEQCTILLTLLEDKQREVVTLKLRNYTNPEIARELGCSLATVERRLKRIRQAWTDYFQDISVE